MNVETGERMADSRITISDGRKVLPKDLCTYCKNGKFVLKFKDARERLKTKMLCTVYECDVCGSPSLRWRYPLI